MIKYWLPKIEELVKLKPLLVRTEEIWKKELRFGAVRRKRLGGIEGPCCSELRRIGMSYELVRVKCDSVCQSNPLKGDQIILTFVWFKWGRSPLDDELRSSHLYWTRRLRLPQLTVPSGAGCVSPIFGIVSVSDC
uniref:Uncharacterized protein n=1 Tax=Ananas comosus var. bracteatus TaxID=296719 RepID=A0A6V7PEE8_ANACO|nr:unnamed protein product [Ananas comosus var. bracteatus]